MHVPGPLLGNNEVQNYQNTTTDNENSQHIRAVYFYVDILTITFGLVQNHFIIYNLEDFMYRKPLAKDSNSEARFACNQFYDWSQS